MAVARWHANRLADDVQALGRRALPRDELYRELAARLRRVVPCDATCWHTLDPQTSLITSDSPQELIEIGAVAPNEAGAAGEKLVASEYFVDDVNTFAGLARRRTPTGILSEATRGHPERSTRYRELLAPIGLPFELRAAFVSRGRAWGAVHVARRERSGDFERADAEALAQVAGAVADAVRATLRFDAARRQDPAAPGLVILGPHNDVELITAPARELLEAMRSAAQRQRDETPPTALLALAAFARARMGGAEPDAVAVPSAGGWITLHASLPESRADGRVAIVLERAATPHVAVLRLEAHGVTPREREVALLLAMGRTNPEIAEALVISPYTVQDHIKSLFEKTGVGSRQELVARVFLEDYLPHVAARAPLTSYGAFAEPAAAGRGSSPTAVSTAAATSSSSG